MILLIDQGNSRLKWRLASLSGEFLDGGVVDGQVRVADYRQLIRSVPAIDAIAISSVRAAPERQALVDALATAYGVRPVLLASQSELSGLRNGYRDPQRLGVDRWLVMLGARSLGEHAWLVVDAGTAVTIDAITARGEHLGGYIVPGFRMQLAMLSTQTANIGAVAASAGGSGWGRDTTEAVAHGVLLSLAAGVERALVELAGAGDDTCRVVVTGGDAGLLAPHLQCSPLLDPDLLFRGMWAALKEAHRGPG